MAKIAIIAGTRPEIIKMASVIRELQNKKITFDFIFTGQHYDYNLSRQFIDELELPSPTCELGINNGSPVSQLAEIMVKLYKILAGSKYDLVLVEGDTNSVLGSALTGLKLGISIGHVEAGLRSYDWRMPEEHNRRIVDHISDLLFAPTKRARELLIGENVFGNIYVTGNTVIDAVIQHLPIGQKNSRIINLIKFKDFILATIHRSENVDNPSVLKNFVSSFLHSPLPIVLPIHPRTLKMLSRYNLLNKLRNSKNIQLLPAIGYLDFLVLMKNSHIIMTDSGGLQEEATAPPIRKPLLILRTSTERPEAVESGFAKLAGVREASILKVLKLLVENHPKLPLRSPFGDGRAGTRTVSIINKVFNNS